MLRSCCFVPVVANVAVVVVVDPRSISLEFGQDWVSNRGCVADVVVIIVLVFDVVVVIVFVVVFVVVDVYIVVVDPRPQLLKFGQNRVSNS